MMQDEPQPTFTPANAAVWMMGALFCMVLLLGTASALNPDVIEDQVSLGALSAVAFLIVTSLLLGRYPGGASLREAIGARAVNPLLLPLGAAIGFFAQAPAEWIRDAIARLLPMEGGEGPVGIVLSSHSRLESAALVLVLVGLVPLAEEAFFRGAVYGALRRSQYTARAAAIVSAIGFTLCHVNARLLLPIGFVAMIFGVLRGTSGSLYPSLVAHMAFNAVPVITSMNGFVGLEAWSKEHTLEMFALLVLSLFIHVVVALRSTVAERGRMEESLPYVALGAKSES